MVVPSRIRLWEEIDAITVPNALKAGVMLDALRQERVQAYWASLTEAEQGSLWCKAVEAANPFFLKMYRDHEGKGNENEERWKGILLYPVLTAVIDALDAEER